MYSKLFLVCYFVFANVTSHTPLLLNNELIIFNSTCTNFKSCFKKYNNNKLEEVEITHYYNFYVFENPIVIQVNNTDVIMLDSVFKENNYNPVIYYYSFDLKNLYTIVKGDIHKKIIDKKIYAGCSNKFVYLVTYAKENISIFKVVFNIRKGLSLFSSTFTIDLYYELENKNYGDKLLHFDCSESDKLKLFFQSGIVEIAKKNEKM